MRVPNFPYPSTLTRAPQTTSAAKILHKASEGQGQERPGGPRPGRLPVFNLSWGYDHLP